MCSVKKPFLSACPETNFTPMNMSPVFWQRKKKFFLHTLRVLKRWWRFSNKGHPNPLTSSSLCLDLCISAQDCIFISRVRQWHFRGLRRSAKCLPFSLSFAAIFELYFFFFKKQNKKVIFLSGYTIQPIRVYMANVMKQETSFAEF